MDKSRIDHIHDFVEVDDETWGLAQSAPLAAELERLDAIGQLGLIEEVFPLAKHTKLEHSVGLHHLTRLACEHIHGLGSAQIQRKAALLAALLHNIGHMPYGFATERALLSVEPWVADVRGLIDAWVDPVRQQLCDGCRGECWRFREQGDHYALFRWHSAAKVLQLGQLDHPTRKETAKYIVCREEPGYNLLYLLDRTEYTVRDLFYLGMLQVDLNALPFLRALRLDTDGSVVPTGVSKTIEALSDYLIDYVYTAPNVLAYEQVYVASVRQALLEGEIDAKQLAAWTDHGLRRWLEQRELEYLGVRQKATDVLGLVGSGRIVPAIQVHPVDAGGKTPAALEASIAGTHGRSTARAALDRGLFVHCERSPIVAGYGEGEPETQAVTIICDVPGVKPRHLATALATSERRLFYPEPREDTRVQFMSFLLGCGCEPGFARFEDAAVTHVVAELRKLGAARAKQLTALRRDEDVLAVKRAYYERDDVAVDELAYDFIHMPHHYTTSFVKRVVARLRPVRARRRQGESVEEAKQRKQTLHEYRYSLQWLLRLRRDARSSWLLPGVVLHDDQGKRWREVDVLCIWVPKTGTRVRATLVACSTDESPSKLADDRDKLGQVAYRLRKRFPRTITVDGFFNDEPVDLT